MKLNKILFGAALFIAAPLLSSCEDDKEPVLQEPDQTDCNFLNTPVLANQEFDLASSDNIEFTLSQPNYGFGTTPHYAVQVSLSPTFDALPDAEWLFNSPDATPLEYQELAYNTTTPILNVPAKDIADAINECRGFNKTDQLSGSEYTDYVGPVYVRVRSYIKEYTGADADRYQILSNVVTLRKVISYPTLRLPAFIYLVGAPTGWEGPTEAAAEHYEDWKLYEKDDEIGSNVYYGTFNIPQGDAMFRFYTALTGWDSDSWGSQVDDNPKEFPEFDGAEPLTKSIVKGKGSYSLPNWPGGNMEICVDLKSKKVTFSVPTEM